MHADGPSSKTEIRLLLPSANATHAVALALGKQLISTPEKCFRLPKKADDRRLTKRAATIYCEWGKVRTLTICWLVPVELMTEEEKLFVVITGPNVR